MQANDYELFRCEKFSATALHVVTHRTKSRIRNLYNNLLSRCGLGVFLLSSCLALRVTKSLVRVSPEGRVSTELDIHRESEKTDNIL